MKHQLKIIWVLICLPFMSLSQDRPDDSLRRIADTMRFKEPFIFSTRVKLSTSANKIYKSCEQWLQSVKDSLPAIDIKKDSLHKRIVATNIPASANISCQMVIVIQNNGYHISLGQFIFHTINGQSIAVEKAVRMPAYKTSVNIERVLIVHNYSTIFQSLKDFLLYNNGS
ncbi:MAG: hypothetical protein QM726_21300 [Chitinophagaceae bacterium]